MRNNFDAIVIGWGAMGTAAIYQLAKRDKTVLADADGGGSDVLAVQRRVTSRRAAGRQ